MKIRSGAPIDPTKITKTIPDIDNLRRALIQVGNIEPKANIREAKEDRRYVQKHWEHTDDNVPSCLETLVDMCKEEVDDPTGYRVYYGSYMRKAMTRLPPPTVDTISRFIFNVGSEDKYVFDSDVPALNNLPSFAELVKRKVGVNIPDRDIVMKADQMLQLGPAITTNYIIYVSPDPKIERPPTINVASRTMNKRQYSLRVAKYHRICVLIDLLGDEEQVRNASRQAEEAVNNIRPEDIQRITASIRNPKGESEGERLSKKEENELRNIMQTVTNK